MAEPFKNFINARLIAEAAGHLQHAWPAFDAAGFAGSIVPQLETLELKARALCVADALERCLPADFDTAADIVERALAPVAARGTAVTEAVPGGLSGWICWPVGEFVARRGLTHPERALACLREITRRFTAEFAIRPFVQQHPALVFDTLGRWVSDPDEHVRRLVSEGTRPRLPWGMQLKALIADPSPTLPFLEALLDDPSAYVRRSVANHLNDIGKDHPALVVSFVERRLPGASAAQRAALRHASRTLIKQGHAPMLALWGSGTAFDGEVALNISPTAIEMGERLTLDVRLVSHAATEQTVIVDYLVHHVKADGSRTPKVFKGWRVTVPPNGERLLRRTHLVKPITTRRYHAGEHLVELQVNGTVRDAKVFRLAL